MKLVLGTANWGQNYGVSGGQIELKEAHLLLDDLIDSGYFEVDTAITYGKAHEYIEAYPRLNMLSVSTKIPCKAKRKSVDQILQSKIDFKRILLHGIPDDVAVAPRLYDFFPGRLGVSVNSLEDLTWVKENSKYLSKVQLPFNFIDRRWHSAFGFFIENGIEIQIRSIFLQGVLLSEDVKRFDFPAPVKAFFKKWKQEYPESERVTQCINFAKNYPQITSQVIGCNSRSQFCELINSNLSISSYELPDFAISDEKLLLPMNWKI